MRTLIPFLVLFSCKSSVDTVETPSSIDAPEWDEVELDFTCQTDAQSDGLVAVALDAQLELATLGFDDTERSKSNYASQLDGPELLPGFHELQENPLEIPCVLGERAHRLGVSSQSPHPVTAVLHEQMALWDVSPAEAPFAIDEPTFSSGVAALNEVLSSELSSDRPDAVPASLDESLGQALLAIAMTIPTWDELIEGVPEDAEFLSAHGHLGLLPDYEWGPDFTDSTTRDWLSADSGPRVLYSVAAQLAFAIEDVDWSAFQGLGEDGALLTLSTSAGQILILGPSDDSPETTDAVLFSLDLGGDDVYRFAAGANGPGAPIGLHIDLGGDDSYLYEEEPVADDLGRLVSDADGRYPGDDNYGPFSMSSVGRQGSGRLGIGMLFDFGQGADTYQSLRMSQGWGQLGVGVLFDDGGDDVYRGEAGMQGAAVAGLGVHMDMGGHDLRESYIYSQGFGYVLGAGVLIDSSGNDTYYADHGDTDEGGDMLYANPQLPGQANTSMSQGMGYGRRGDADGVFFPGGTGMLVDFAGDDAYVAGVFGQGSGYWQGLGALVDQGGDDTYDAFWYVQGGAAHYAIGAVLDGGGNDLVGGTLNAVNMNLGAGHDFSIGLFANAGGDDDYRFTTLGAGVGNCQGIGLFADESGTDSYLAASNISLGTATMAECTEGDRAQVPTIGLFVDAGGDSDAYAIPGDASRTVSDDLAFGQGWNEGETELGGGVDTDGVASMYPGNP